ncbi:methyl-accepting chemotaxis protein [Desulfovibrio sp. UCD-KL4C]|uniref:methyl-accepting chemotaxis protein n=1 Tax=Desulfovibrio sp. UCD-KL4C TaxID=2578120 RepID=UPI0025C7113E|nr:methyl-accepting chemotaxis protein [Desulfovibrio sp. UCD-KL4C]
MFRDLSIKWKVLIISVAGPLVVALVMDFMQSQSIRKQAVQAIVAQSRAITLQAEATRDEMAKKLKLGIIKPFDQISKKNILEAVPVITAISTAKANAKKLGYQFRVPKESPRNPLNKPTPFESKILAELKEKNLEELVIRETGQVRYFRPIRLSEECLYCHGDPKGQHDAVGGIKEGWKAGEIHGAFELVFSMDKANAKIATAGLQLAGITAAILALITIVVWILLKKSIIGPLLNIETFASNVADGDLNAKPNGSFSAELGSVKHAIETMVGRLKEKMEEASFKSKEAEAQTLRAEEALETTKTQEAKVSSLLQKITRIAQKAQGIGQQVSSAAEELSAQIELVNRGADIQNQRTTETVTAMEEMNATVLEVARNSGSAAESADTAREYAGEGSQVVEQSVESIQLVYEQAKLLKVEMTALGQKADDINRILEVINDIADQTNLLALNAAIEAARAGDAGRGFAVVADEVRKLAEKTMNATKDVSATIVAIQTGAHNNIESVDRSAKATEAATDLAHKSGEALDRIVGLVNDTSDQVRSIATAAEEQSVASDEINQAVDDINRITQETSAGMNESAKSVAELTTLAQELQALIDEMVDND